MRNKNLILAPIVVLPVIIIIILGVSDGYFRVYRSYIENTIKTCSSKNISHNNRPTVIHDSEYDEYIKSRIRIVEIDRCEYFVVILGSLGPSITHKGNCKYCISRSKKNN